ncbi:hypothetical protein BZM27_32910 [Paraburkholderia steynii]|uniref:Uncharacterized protein n=1 Tax=Paraburkholderia steynii TaxID=1245441 RepID=A0A4R0X9C0_9BURK|nr:hypothetical protein BZM27_32910 [Paraburkholderia steynii]
MLRKGVPGPDLVGPGVGADDRTPHAIDRDMCRLLAEPVVGSLTSIARMDTSLDDANANNFGADQIIGIPAPFGGMRARLIRIGCCTQSGSSCILGFVSISHVAVGRRNHAMDAKDNFEFERQIPLCRSDSVLDLRHKK